MRNVFMSVDPYMRGRMNDAKSYVPPYELGKVMYGGAVGEVVAGDEPGQLVVHQLGWREHALVDAGACGRASVPDGVPPSALLGALGMPGLTAWVGVTDIAPVAEGETVFVSAAAGAVGSVAGQIAKARGCRVIGSAGAPEKVAYVRDELGFDAAFSHHDDVARRAARGGARRRRRLLRQRRRPAARGRHRRAEPRRPDRAVRRGLAVQRDRAGARPAQPRRCSSASAGACAASSSATTPSARRTFRAEVERAARRAGG